MLKELIELTIDRNKSITCEGIPVNFTLIKEITVTEGINEHTGFRLVGETVEGSKFSVGEEIKVIAFTNTNSILNILRKDMIFAGVIEKIEILGSHITIEAKSFSVELDRKKKKRSFQDIKKTYEDLVNVVKEEGKYDKFNFIYHDVNNKPLDQLFVQYDETDWEFLKRVCSTLGKGIVIENGKSLENESTKTKDKKWNIWFAFEADGTRPLESTSFITKGKENHKERYLIISTKKKHEIGYLLTCEGRTYIVSKSKITYVNSIVNYEYRLVEKDKFVIPKISNLNIAGQSVLAEVVEVGTGENLTRVRVDFVFENTNLKKDEKEDDPILESKEAGNTRKAWDKYWFKFATPYSSSNGGIYFMPELKDRLLVNFINSNEDSGFAGESLRDKNELQETQSEVVHKRIKISTGQQIMLSKELEKVMLIGNEDRTVFADVVKDHIRFVADESEAVLKKELIILKNCENTVQMNPDGMLLQTGDSTVKMTSDGISLKIGDAEITMKNGGIEIKCGGGGISIANGKVNVKG